MTVVVFTLTEPYVGHTDNGTNSDYIGLLWKAPAPYFLRAQERDEAEAECHGVHNAINEIYF